MSSDNAAPSLSREAFIGKLTEHRDHGKQETPLLVHDAAQRAEIQCLKDDETLWIALMLELDAQIQRLTTQNSGLTEEIYSLRAAGMRDQATIQRLRVRHGKDGKDGNGDQLRDSTKVISPPAEPSGNTGELPTCATCGDARRCIAGINRERVMEYWTCPDCSAAQPARHSEALSSFTAYCQAHPSERFWQALRNWSRWNFILGAQARDGGTIDTFNLEGLDGTHDAQPATEQPRIWADHGDVAGIHHSDDNGKTWIDEQAEVCSQCGAALVHVAGPGVKAVVCPVCDADSSALDEQAEREGK